MGLRWLWWYETTPGKLASLPTQWPAESRLELNSDRPTLLIFAHPRCPCTRATIAELARLVAHASEKADVQVLFFKPGRFDANWDKTDLWQSTKEIPGVKVFSDEDGIEAKRFQATTSGHSLLFNPAGRLLFSGGITISRGHAGDNPGRLAIESILTNGIADHRRTMIYGCSLVGGTEACVSQRN